MTQLDKALISDIIWKSLVQRIKVGDKYEFTDERMLNAIHRDDPFTPNEQETLLNSPISLRRYRKLLDREQRQKQSTESWSLHDEVTLLAAASEDNRDLPLLNSESGDFTVRFDEAPDGSFDIVIAVTSEKIPASAKVRLKDAEGNILLSGQLDEDGVLDGSWPMSAPPRQHLESAGAKLALELSNTTP